jgi:hypothetical protein
MPDTREDMLVSLMDTFADIANVVYRLSFADQGKQRTVTVLRKKNQTENRKRRTSLFSLIRLPFTHLSNGSLSFARVLTKKKNGSYPFAIFSPEGLRYLLSIAGKTSPILFELPKGCPMPFIWCSMGFQELPCTFLTCLSIKLGFPECYLEVKRPWFD